MILGTIEHICTRKHLAGEPLNLLHQLDPLVDLILDGIRVQKGSKNISIHLHLGEGGITVSDKDSTTETQGP
jgi:hypothetical protein